MNIKSFVVILMFFEIILGMCPKYYVTEYSAKNMCYFLSTSEFHWNTGKTGCDASGGMLAKITDDSDHQFLQQFMVPGVFYWIGLNDIDTDQTYVWTDNTPVTWSRWRSDQPNGAADQNCVVYDAERWWQDKSCTELYNFICQIDSINNGLFYRVDHIQDTALLRKFQVVDKVICILHCVATTNCKLVVVDMSASLNNCWLLENHPGGNVFLPYSQTMLIFQSGSYSQSE